MGGTHKRDKHGETTKMPQSTMIARVSDGLPLAASVDDEQTETDLAEYKQQAKLIFRRLTPTAEPRCSIESGKATLHYLIQNGIVYLTIAEKSYPRKLAFSYLDELSKEFERSYADEAFKPQLRPYAFVKFDTFIQRTKRLYQDSRTMANAKGGCPQCPLRCATNRQSTGKQHATSTSMPST